MSVGSVSRNSVLYSVKWMCVVLVIWLMSIGLVIWNSVKLVV